MKLYSHPAQPNAIRVTMFMDELRIDLPIIEVDMLGREHLGDAYLEKNPFGQVPCFVFDDGTVLTESLVICRYLDHLFGGPRLFGAGEQQRAVISMWERRAEFTLFHPAIEYGHNVVPEMAGQIAQHPEWAAAQLPKMERALEIFDHQLAGNAYLAGPTFTVADITGFLGASYVRQLAGIELPANVARWAAGIAERHSARSFHAGQKSRAAFLQALAGLDW
jgi:glutathione S-transferase